MDRPNEKQRQQMLENLFRTHVMRFFFCCYCYCCCWYFLLLLMCFANGDLIHFSFKWFPVRDTCSPRQHQTTTAAAQQQTKCLENDEKWKATDRTTWIWPFWAFIKSKRLLIIGSIGMVSRLATVKKNRLNNIDFFLKYSSHLIRQSRCAVSKEIKLIVITALKLFDQILFFSILVDFLFSIYLVLLCLSVSLSK